MEDNRLCEKIDSATHGRVHSIESFATLDGPGLRTVIFMQGCPMRCQYCHNVDIANTKGGTEYSVDALVERLLKNKVYWDTSDLDHIKGGVTFSGGEPTFQHDFVCEVAKRLKALGVHTTIDTSLLTSQKSIDQLLPFIDYWMVSIKHLDNEKHKDLTGAPNTLILRNLKYLDEKLKIENRKDCIRVRFVLIPTITDSEEYIHELGKFVKEIESLDVLEILPYTSIGKYKWIEQFASYPFENVPEATSDDTKKAQAILSKYVRVKV